MTITVSMAYWHAAPYVERAVRSILEQTYTDLRLVVIGDGDRPPLDGIDDSRLTVLTLDENRGPYFCDAVVMAACDTEWFTIHAADDWSDPGRLSRLMEHAHGYDAVFGGSLQHRGRNVRRRRTRFDEAGDELKHVGSIATGIYRTEALRRIGAWPHPDFRVAYDTMLVHLVLRALRWTHVRGEYGYHRIWRPDSLTNAPTTGLGSDFRAEVVARRDALWREVIAAPVEEWPRILTPSIYARLQVDAEADYVRRRESAA